MRFQHVRSFIPVLFGVANAGVTVWGTGVQVPLTASATSSNAAAAYTGAAAYNPTVLNPPPVPSPAPGNFDIQLQTGAVPGLSIPLPGSFFGFSVEFSVANQVLGKNSTLLQVPFLNLMANLVARGGEVHVRVGGNTQETASLVDYPIPNGADLTKDYGNSQNPTATPPLVYNRDILSMMSNISDLTNVKWYLGLPFNDTSNFRLQIAEVGQAILGNKLIGLQVGNEPDLYSRHGHRDANYDPAGYTSDFGLMVQALAADPNVQNRNMLIGPNLAGTWTPESVWDTGFATTYSSSLSALAVEHYPTDNCAATFGIGAPVDPQTAFPDFLNHTSGKNIVAPYLGSTAYAQTLSKPFIMFETNTASCGGFAGISDAFGAALWGADYGLQMAYSNFTGALFHIIDLNANGGNEFTPAYAVYENGQPVRIALFNFITDPSGASSYTATISIGSTTPAQVKVKYTFGGNFGSDGRLTGDQDIKTVACNGGTCQVTVPAPSFALVFLSDDALTESDGGPTQTFPTTLHTKAHNTANVDASVLATSNGHKAFALHYGSTSRGTIRSSAFGMSQALPSMAALICIVTGSLLISRTLSR
ncbi:hypothetical protein HWV62_11580 [Athelia sp. TMB]|nr:hypothetical protein HWV62_11580 [Athelia sp. TMB]